jgi:hypothetical protein
VCCAMKKEAWSIERVQKWVIELHHLRTKPVHSIVLKEVKGTWVVLKDETESEDCCLLGCSTV